ncbi:negative regulator of sigma-B (phosphoserine phosphatase) [Bacillus tianshenii]|uniref:Negative regulator of sigma-B (Phosphoserine phosphatase) n=1 Tax=Sutcliffiella tianshenii TaxID=1463404 RepID=A0ABS2P404_9BACI|nr:PP2C family serine/threonine-protein phosphatase [Bacillus tianshenii]MBM7621691.1 negative regulator of sigma-B (phosphoserine phosphatase) [Bacillus tianshenii]
MIENFQHEKVNVNAYQNPKNGMYFCGDSYYVNATDNYFICVVADGLGSGEYAHDASQAVISAAKAREKEDVTEIMKACNEAMKNKRGAAVSVFKVNYDKQEVVYSCVGNIRFFLYPPSEKLIYPLPVKGYLSGKPQNMKTHRFPFSSKMKFFVYSDGLNIPSVRKYIKDIPSATSLLEIAEIFTTDGMDDVTIISGEIL